MKAKYILGVLLLSVLALAACTRENGNPSPEAVQRTVVYRVDKAESTKTVTTDNEWDALLDHFCDYAKQGKPVAFYSVGSRAHSPKGSSKEKETISTTSRDEIKAWMKQMEKQGKTVNITYDDTTDTWTGVAYATIGNQPQQQGQSHTGVLVHAACPALDNMPLSGEVLALQVEDSTLYLAFGGFLLVSSEIINVGDDPLENTLVTMYGSVSEHLDLNGDTYWVLDLSTIDESKVNGKWQMRSLTMIESVTDGANNAASIYWWENEGDAVYYDFQANGIAILSQGSTVKEGSWNLGGDGTLCCSLFEDGECWYINWLSDETMILTHQALSAPDTYTFYQMMLERADK